MPPRETDALLIQYVKEIEERQAFIEGLVADPKGENGDLSDEQVELVTKNRDRIKKVNELMQPLEEVRQIGSDSAERIAAIAHLMSKKEPPAQVEYRSAGEYAIEMWKAGLGDEDAKERMRRWGVEHMRAAAHETTAQISGLLPAPIVGPVVNYIDAARPLVNALGPRQLPGTGFSRPKVTQHTAVGVQSAEKAELTSQYMTIQKLTVTPQTIGGYVNVSRQAADWSQPSIMQIVIEDLAAQYAIQTEGTAVQMFYGTATAGGTIDSTPTGDEVAGQFWAAAASVYTATKGQGRVIAVASPDVLGSLGPLFQPVNPTNAQGEGFMASTFGQGVAGSISGIPVIVTSGFGTTKRLMLMSTAAGEVYEDRIGSLSVVEPSVLGVQVAYAGYFAALTIEPTAIVKVTVT
jgi:HK97 family phage major capsid protein